MFVRLRGLSKIVVVRSNIYCEGNVQYWSLVLSLKRCNVITLSTLLAIGLSEEH